MMTPLQIEILLHYNCGSTDYRDGDFSAPAVSEALRQFQVEDLLEPTFKTGVGVMPQPKFALTDRGSAYVAALQAVPLPEWVPGRWDTSLLRPGTNRNDITAIVGGKAPLMWPSGMPQWSPEALKAMMPDKETE